ncbi:MAG: (d)CMP kinase [Alphaproteobacteria bacterium]|nr:(d)CMP kinase [Alphaproteobacteria bacterium]
MIIAIDGPAAAGKGTLAQNLAKHFKYAFLDTGRLYRAVGYAVLQAKKDPSDETEATKAAKAFDPKSINQILSNPALREEATGNAASKVAVIPSVREALLQLQRDFAEHPFFEDGTPAKGAVLDGRDIGTVVCPNADVKLFVTASAEVRADRRFKELKDAGKPADYDVILKDIKERDERDSKRATAPLKPAEDAYVLDTSNMNATQAYQAALDFIAINHA